MRDKRILVCIWLILVILGCKSTLHPVEANKELISQVKVGESTKDDIRNTFGTPNEILKTDSPMEETWIYIYTSPVSSVPAAAVAVRMFTGTTTRTTAKVTYTFDQKGIVRSVQPIYYQAADDQGSSTVK